MISAQFYNLYYDNTYFNGCYVPMEINYWGGFGIFSSINKLVKCGVVNTCRYASGPSDSYNSVYNYWHD